MAVCAGRCGREGNFRRPDTERLRGVSRPGTDREPARDALAQPTTEAATRSPSRREGEASLSVVVVTGR